MISEWPRLLARIVAAGAASLVLTAGVGQAQCGGDCQADGAVTIDELVTMVGVALGTTPVIACGAGDSNVDGSITIDEVIGAVANSLGDCRGTELRRSFDFRGGRQGWLAGFADYSPEMAGNLELDAGPRTLPPELGLEGPGFLLSGFNQSDDLFMFLKRQLTSSDGIQPNQAYSVDFSIVFASAAPSGCPGIGGAPGESVFLKAGASAVEPIPVLDTTENQLRMNIDKGNQAQGGANASLAGNVANGQPCETGSAPYVSLRRQHIHMPAISANAGGELWLIVGTDSGFEGTTAIYYQRIDVKLTPLGAPGRFELNDVSILFPLPAVADLDALLRPASTGERGALLSATRYASIPKLHVFQSPEQTYDLLRVVAARIDPCFRTAAACRPQIRLSMQPLSIDSTDDVVRADDAAIHLFYDLSEGDFAALIAELRALKANTDVSTAGALRVHPILAAEGVNGPFAGGLRSMILRYAGDANLSRITFMQLQNFNVNEWVFGGFEVDGDELQSITIIDADSPRQRFINVFLESEEDFVASVDPQPLGTDDLTLLFNSTRARAAGASEVDAAFAAALRIENPNVHSTESVSCVACHVSTQTRLWTENNLGRSAAGHPDRYTSAEDLSLTSETTRIPASIRAFGYLHRRVALGQRVVNETAAVVTLLNAKP